MKTMNVLALNDEYGNEHEFEFLDLMEYKGDEYVVLLPLEESSTEVVILKVDDTDPESDEEEYTSVDDEEILNILFEMFKEKFKNEFNFV